MSRRSCEVEKKTPKISYRLTVGKYVTKWDGTVDKNDISLDHVQGLLFPTVELAINTANQCGHEIWEVEKVEDGSTWRGEVIATCTILIEYRKKKAQDREDYDKAQKKLVRKLNKLPKKTTIYNKDGIKIVGVRSNASYERSYSRNIQTGYESITSSLDGEEFKIDRVTDYITKDGRVQKAKFLDAGYKGAMTSWDLKSRFKVLAHLVEMVNAVNAWKGSLDKLPTKEKVEA
jgi:hypothetical protein